MPHPNIIAIIPVYTLYLLQPNPSTNYFLGTFQAKIGIFCGLQANGKRRLKKPAIPLFINKKAPKCFNLGASKKVL